LTLDYLGDAIPLPDYLGDAIPRIPLHYTTVVSIIAIDTDTIGDTFEVSLSVSAILLCENIDIEIGDTFFGVIAIDYRDTIQCR
jgi:hypothetical protein